jgi:ribosomally synthesized peptide (two-chain TOMM family)
MSAARRKEMPEQQPPQGIGDLPRGIDHTPEYFALARRWQIIWLRAIAKAWAEEDFKRELKEDARAALCKHFNYKLNPELDLTIKDASEVDPKNTPCYNPDAEDPWEGLPHHKLELVLPPAPPVEDRAIALADYGDTGRTYPMTSG